MCAESLGGGVKGELKERYIDRYDSLQRYGRRSVGYVLEEDPNSQNWSLRHVRFILIPLYNLNRLQVVQTLSTVFNR